MAPVPAGATVAVTGASGFIGSHVCAALLQAGYRVRALVRDPTDESKTAHLRTFEGSEERLTFHGGRLDEPGSYDIAFSGADAVIHTAAVVEIGHSKNPEEEIVKPSVEGVQNVLASAAKSSSLKRFVHTSSCAATFKWDEPLDATFSEDSWNTVSTVKNGDPYGYAKAQAEKFVLEYKHDQFDCVSINPGVNLGPCLTKAHTKASAVVVRQFIYGNKQPEYHAHFVDVRDTARAHVLALTADLTGDSSRRFLCCSDDQMQVSALEPHLTRLFPDYLMEANPNPNAAMKVLLSIPVLWRAFVSEFEHTITAQKWTLNNEKSKKHLGLKYRELDETLRDTVNSMIDTSFGESFVKARKRA